MKTLAWALGWTLGITFMFGVAVFLSGLYAVIDCSDEGKIVKHSIGYDCEKPPTQQEK